MASPRADTRPQPRGGRPALAPTNNRFGFAVLAMVTLQACHTAVQAALVVDGFSCEEAAACSGRNEIDGSSYYTSAQCAAACIQEPTCVSFEWASEGGAYPLTCHLSTSCMAGVSGYYGPGESYSNWNLCVKEGIAALASTAATTICPGSTTSNRVLPENCPCYGGLVSSDCADGLFCCGDEGFASLHQYCLPGALFPGDLECQDYGGLIGLIVGILCGLACLIGGAAFFFVGSKPKPPQGGAYGAGPGAGAYQEGGGGSYGQGPNAAAAF